MPEFGNFPASAFASRSVLTHELDTEPEVGRRPIVPETGLTRGFKIGGVEIPNSLILAPMAGVADGPFRRICGSFGAGLTVSELANARALLLGLQPTIDLARFLGQPRPFAVQIFGFEPDIMGRAAALVESMGLCDIIDINMGCPVSKVVKTGAGAALMNDSRLAGQIIDAVKRAVSLPVTVKFRLGWTQNTINAREFTKMALDHGVAAIAVHARTKEAGYTGRAQWEQLAGLGNLCGSVPFIANGDIAKPTDIEDLYKISGCRGYMVGRHAIGRPWIVSELLGRPVPAFGMERYEVFRNHLRETIVEHGSKGVGLFRVHLFAYLRNHPGVSAMRYRMCNERDPVVVLQTGREFFLGAPFPDDDVYSIETLKEN